MSKKEFERITFLIDPEIKEQFFEACRANFTTPTQELRRFTYSRLQDFEPIKTLKNG